MDNTTITASAPGSLMISGEHAVLHARHALVGAVDHRIRVTLIPRADDGVVLRSALGERRMTRSQIDATPPFGFAGAVLQAHSATFPRGCDVQIAADFPPDVGLGSSAAVTVALLAALRTWIDGAPPAGEALMQEAVTLIRSVQGMGSGCDAAASVWGGVVLCRSAPTADGQPSPERLDDGTFLSTSNIQHPTSNVQGPLLTLDVGRSMLDVAAAGGTPGPAPDIIERFAALPAIALVYAGYKTSTPEVVRMVEEQRRAAKDGFRRLFDRFDEATLAAATAFRHRDWEALGKALCAGQQVMTEMGVSDVALSTIVEQMNRAPGILGAKISGSGLGDCVLGIGTLGPLDWPYRQIPVALSARGMAVEKGA